jgi:hypothetical protein
VGSTIKYITGFENQINFQGVMLDEYSGKG